MISVQVVQYLDSDQTEALVEISNESIKLLAYSCPFRNRHNNENVTLHTLFAWNIGPTAEWHAPKKIANTPFSYRLCAEVVDLRNRIVRIGNIILVLDTEIDSNFHVGSWISFDVTRLDY